MSVTILIYGATAFIAFACGVFVGLFWNTKTMQYWHDTAVGRKYAVESLMNACREVLNVKQFERVRRRALEIGAELEAKRRKWVTNEKGVQE